MAIFYKLNPNTGRLVAFKIQDNGDGTFSEVVATGAASLTNDGTFAKETGGNLATVATNSANQQKGLTLTSTLQNAVATNANGSSVQTAGYMSALFSISGLGSATINFEMSNDNGANWYTVPATSNGTINTIATANGLYGVGLAGLDSVNGLIRARISNYSSGTITVTVTLSTVLRSNKFVNLGQYGYTSLLTGTMTRPSDTTAYAAGDGVTTATSGAAALSIPNAARVAGIGGVIFGGFMEKSTTVTTNAQFRGWIYQDTPSAIPNDNAAFTAAVHADYQKLVGTFTVDFSAGIVGSDGVRAVISLERPNMAFKIPTGTSLTVILEARAAYGPGNAEVFRLGLDVSQD